MMTRGVWLTVLGLTLAGTSLVRAGNIYEITSRDGAGTRTYEVRFGGGKLMDRYTAFDPESKKFVYLEWKRSGDAPVAVQKIWDHRSGEIIPLYRFPQVKQPLPVIPSLDEMKVCPLTGDKDFKSQLKIIVD